MSASTRKEKEEKLNRAVNLWKSTRKEGNEAEWQRRKDDVWICFYEWCGDWDTIRDPLYADHTDGKSIRLLDVFVYTLEKFEAERRIPYSRFFKCIWDERIKDSEEKREQKKRTISLDAPVSSEEEGAARDVADPNTEDIDHRIEVEERLADLAALMLNLRERIGSRAANATGERWYRMFFAEDITTAVKTLSLTFRHERDIMKALYQSYMDYYMTKKCRSTAQIRKTPLEPLCKFTDNPADTQETAWDHFPVCVALTYLERCENAVYAASEYSNKRKTYREILRREQI